MNPFLHLSTLQFSTRACSIVAKLATLLIVIVPALSSADINTEFGAEYKSLLIPVQAKNQNAIEVRVFYGYDCADCYAFHQFVENWGYTVPEDVQLEKTLVTKDLSSGLHELYLLIDQLPEASALHTAVFEQVLAGDFEWQDPDKKENLLSEYGVAKERFSQFSNQATLAKKIRNYAAQEKIFRVSQVPAIIINGKYLMDGSSLKDSEKLTQVMEYLLERERVLKN